MVKKIIAYSGVFLVSFVLFLVLMAPASFVWERLLRPNVGLSGTGVSVESVDGTIWNGHALVGYQGVEAILRWEVSGLGLASLSFPVEISIDSHLGKGRLNIAAGLFGTDVAVQSLEVYLSALNKILLKRRVELSGTVLARNLLITLEGKTIASASGEFSWTGGDIAYPVQRSVHERNVPPLKGSIKTVEDGTIYVGLKDAQSTFNPIDISLSPKGVALLQVKRRLLDLVDEPSPYDAETDTVFKVKKTIY